MIKKIIVSFALASSLLFGAGVAPKATKILTDMDIQTVERGILNAALKHKDAATVSQVALSYYMTAESPLYKGDREALHKRALDLLLYSVKNGNVSGALFLATKYLKQKPVYSREIAKRVIEEAKENELLLDNPEYYSLVMIYASSVLDNEYSSEKEVNYAIEAIMGLPYTDAQANFFLAFLFKAIGSYNLADTYLNDACHQSKPGSNIYSYCLGGSDIEKVDAIEDNVIKKDCNADIGQRCK